MNQLIAHTFNHSDTSFTQALDAAGIQYVRRFPFPPGTPVASGFGIEISLTEAWGALAAVCLAWCLERRSRHIKVTTKDGRFIELKGYGAEDAVKILVEAKTIAVIDTEKPPQE